MRFSRLLRRISFSLWYFGSPPWESGIVPPEVEQFIHANAPGRVLDLGCGSGTSSLAFARAGWNVIGVDFAPPAIRRARRKAANTGLAIDFRLGDVTHLPAEFYNNPFDLVLDIGCFHALEQEQKLDYLAALPRLLAPGGTWLLYAFFRESAKAAVGLREQDILAASQVLELFIRQDSLDPKGRRSVWLKFCKAK